MAARLLIYHMENSRRQALEGLLEALHIAPVPVEEANYCTPIGLLSGQADIALLAKRAGEGGPKGPVHPIDEEMIVMSDFSEEQFHALLDGMKEISLRVSLKAVETPTNMYWTGEMLQEELRQERQAMEERRDRKA